MNGSLTPAKRGLALWWLSIRAFLAGTAVLCAFALIPLGVGFWLIKPAARQLRSVASTARARVRDWFGVEIPEAYAPERDFPRDLQGRVAQVQWMATDPAARQDVAWSMVEPFTGGLLAALPAFLMLYGVSGILQTPLYLALHSSGYRDWYYGIPVVNLPLALLCLPVGVLSIVVGLTRGSAILARYARWEPVLLRPPGSALARRVEQLTVSRAEAVDASAAELRRIERDLHDGAQARLVAMGMTLGAIEHLLEKDPEKARALLAETRSASTKALRELRDLVRGIHPPVLADRGLADAVRALALDNPLRVEVDAQLTGRLDAPLESAAYFAVAEILTNATKHSGAARVWIELRRDGRVLHITITDDGRGGASFDKGTGLRGIERRIGAFDGLLALSSPLGGPTIVTMEIPT